ncbi:MAG: TIGR02206 family membrane protein [Clostridia bacterium]|nr:TIGR02206 family membrane protein [Clostridia bacterium]
MNFDYEFYYEGFFGYSLTQDFEYWSLAHLLPIFLLIGAIIATYFLRNKIKNCKFEESLRFILGFLLILNEGFYYWRVMYVGNGGSSDPTQLITKIPLQVCEWSAYISAFMLMKKSKHAFDICFYVCLTLGIIPYFMPAVIMQTGPGYARYYQFWIEHLIPVYAVFYMMFVHGFKPNYKKVYKPFAMLAILATLAIIANYNIEGANFMYLASGTAGDSIANMLPESIPVRLLLYIGILIVLFSLLSLPQIIRDIKAFKAKKKAYIKQDEKSLTNDYNEPKNPDLNDND